MYLKYCFINNKNNFVNKKFNTHFQQYPQILLKFPNKNCQRHLLEIVKVILFYSMVEKNFFLHKVYSMNDKNLKNIIFNKFVNKHYYFLIFFTLNK